MLIPNQLIALATFPGVIVHEISHRLVCDLLRVSVYDVSYFRVGTPSGYVLHAPSPNLKVAFLIASGPLVINTFLAALIGTAAVIPFFTLNSHTTALEGVLLWLAVSIGMHAFPSNEDLLEVKRHISESASRHRGHLLASLFATWFRVMNFLRVVWVDLIYALVVLKVAERLLVG